MAEDTTWLEHAKCIWGDQWVAPMARAIGRNRRTVQRWKGTAFGYADGAGECPPEVRQALRNAVRALQRAHQQQPAND